MLSFGLCNAPSQFARIMELVMSGLTYDKLRGIGSPKSCHKQAAVGSQGSGGTIKTKYSAEEMLKASVSNEGE